MKPPKILNFRLAEDNKRGFQFTGNLPTIDTTRDIAVYIRQSGNGADTRNGESRETQLSLKEYAKSLLKYNNSKKSVKEYDEGAGVSGQKRIDERPKLDELYRDIASGKIGTIIVAMENRLFRDKHLIEVGHFTELAEKKCIILIIPPIVSNYANMYDFTKYDDLDRFQEEMKASFRYIAKHVGYMNANQRKKAEKGLYDGRPLPAGLTVRRDVDRRCQTIEIYEPWSQVVKALAQRAKELNYNIPLLNIEIAAGRFLFPLPTDEDKKKYILKTRMTLIPDKGYTLKSSKAVKRLLTNKMLVGMWQASEESDVTTNNHPAILDRETFEKMYIHITGYTIYGGCIYVKSESIRINEKHGVPDALFHGKLLVRHKGMVYNTSVFHRNDGPVYQSQERIDHLNDMRTFIMVPSALIDNTIIERLKDLIQQDENIASKIDTHLKHVKTDQEVEYASLLASHKKTDEELEKVEDKMVVTDKNTRLYNKYEKRYNELSTKKEQIELKMERLGVISSKEEIREFFDVLDNFNEKYPEMLPENKKKLFSLLIDHIEIESISPHWLLLTVKWITALHTRIDVAYVWRNQPERKGAFTDHAKALLRELYPRVTSKELMQAFPDRTLDSIARYGKALNITGLSNPYPCSRNTAYSDIFTHENKPRFSTLEYTVQVIETVQNNHPAFWMIDESMLNGMEQIYSSDKEHD